MPGNFHATAQNVELKDGHILKAKLTKADGHHHHAEIDLNEYIGNSDGWFLWDGKNFSHSARNITLTKRGDGWHLEAELPMVNGHYRERQGIVLSDRFENVDGSFRYLRQ